MAIFDRIKMVFVAAASLALCAPACALEGQPAPAELRAKVNQLADVCESHGVTLPAVALQFPSEWLRTNYTDLHTFIFGGIIVVAVVLLPMGLVSFARESWAHRRISLLDTVRAYRL